MANDPAHIERYARKCLEQMLGKLWHIVYERKQNQKRIPARFKAFLDGHAPHIEALLDQAVALSKEDMQYLVEELVDKATDNVFRSVHRYAKTKTGDITPTQMVEVTALQKKMALLLALDNPLSLDANEHVLAWQSVKDKLVALIIVQVVQNMEAPRPRSRPDDSRAAGLQP